MSPVFYHIAHLVGLILLFVGFGGLLSGDADARRSAMKFHGIGLIILLVAGFGLIAKLKLPYTSPFIIAKVVIFLVLGFLPVLARKRTLPAGTVVLIAVALGGCAAYLGYLKALPF
jgi:hypothetical protein